MNEMHPVPKPAPREKKHNPRWKRREQNVARRMQEVEGRAADLLGRLATNIGRVGHLSELQFDTVTARTCVEVKDRKLPGWLNDAWIQIQQVALEHKRRACLVLFPQPDTFSWLQHEHRNSPLYCVTRQTYEHLAAQERLLLALRTYLGEDAYNDFVQDMSPNGGEEA